MKNQTRLRMTVNDCLELLRTYSNPDIGLEKAQKFGVVAPGSWGVFQRDINQIAKQIGKNTELGIELIEHDQYDGLLLASKLIKPTELPKDVIKPLIARFDTWEITDSFSMKVFAPGPFADDIIQECASAKGEFSRRTSYATIAGLCSADKKSLNERFIHYFPLIIEAATDNRNFVKKAVNWALRSIGKRNPDLRNEAILVAEELILSDSKSARWIAKDALKELQQDSCRISNYPRSIYST